MNAQTKIEAANLPVVPTNAAAAVVLFDADKFDAFLAKLKADVDATPVDLTTKKGRDAIASVAAKVRSQKAGIDKDRLRLTKEWRDMTSQVNGAWNEIKERMDELAVKARKPLTDWEEAEQARIDRCDAIINKLAVDGVVTIDDTAETVRARGNAVWATEIDAELFGDKFEQAERAKEHAVAMLKTSLARLTREEAERAELEKLRAEAAERDRIEAERIAAEQERAEREGAAKAAEERRIEAEKAEADRIERVRLDAANAAREEAERAKQAEIDAANERARQAEAEAQRQRDEAERVERQRIEAEEAAAAEQKRRDEDRAHRGQVMGAAKEALMTCGADEETAKKIVLAIVAGEVPAVSLRF